MSMELSEDLLVEIGAAVLTLVSTTVTLGHTSPAATLDYIHRPLEESGAQIARDLVAWSSGKSGMSKAARERLSAYVVNSGWQRGVLGAMASELTTAPPP